MRSILAVPLAVLLTLPGSAYAQTVVDSVFTTRPNEGDNYSNPANWSPPEVPNNSADKKYNVTMRFGGDVDVDATINNLTFGGGYLSVENHSLTVLGSTSTTGRIAVSSTAPVGAMFAAGALSSFSAGVLTGDYDVSNYDPGAGPATLQFNGADVRRLSNGTVRLRGALARIVDESGANALRNLGEIDADAELAIEAQHVRHTVPLTNAGRLAIESSHDHPATFDAAGGLTGFDGRTRTLSGGAYEINTGYYPPESAGRLAILQFPGADIVTNAASLRLSGPLAKITDETGRDALRNLAHNAGILELYNTDFKSAGDFRNSGSLFVFGSNFIVSGSLQNFDPASRTLLSGTYWLSNAQLSFRGADIVRNAASLMLSGEVKITDEHGADALRNFTVNEAAGSLEVLHAEFIPNADFTNEGSLAIQAYFAMRTGRRYLQTAGKTEIRAGGDFVGPMDIEGGELTGFSRFHEGPATIYGALRVRAALLLPREINVRGPVTLAADTRYQVNRYTESPHDMVADLVVSGPISLAGTIDLPDPVGFPPSSNDSYVTIRSQQLTGAFSNAPNGSRVATMSGQGSFIVSYANNEVVVSGYQRVPPAAQLLNVSTRARVGTGNNAAIAGFIIFGREPKKVIVRGIGPSLDDSGTRGALADPVLDLHGPNGEFIVTNNDWRDSQEIDIRTTSLAPSDDLESAIVATLAPGNYTAVLRGRDQTDGVALVEVYDLSETSSKVANISTRAFVDSANPLIAGFIAGGPGEGSAELVVRAIGAGFNGSRISNFLPDPAVEVRNREGELVAANDDYAEPNANAWAIGSDLRPHAEKDAALVVTVPRGDYTALVRGKGDDAGIALVEVYDRNR